MSVGGRLRQREFFTFGMDVLMKLDLEETRQFFSAFFNLSDYYWQVGFRLPLLLNITIGGGEGREAVLQRCL